VRFYIGDLVGRKSMGRAKGSRNRSYFFRSGRGWCAKFGNELERLPFASLKPLHLEQSKDLLLNSLSHEATENHRSPISVFVIGIADSSDDPRRHCRDHHFSRGSFE
ncbi:MAG TPA: hypothetical protein VGM98_10135, partial [Schlesneria sp.]